MASICCYLCCAFYSPILWDFLTEITQGREKNKPVASIFYESSRNFVSASGSGMWFSLIQNCDFCCGISILQTGINGAYQSFLSCLTHKAFLRAKHPCPDYLLTSIRMSLPFFILQEPSMVLQLRDTVELDYLNLYAKAAHPGEWNEAIFNSIEQYHTTIWVGNEEQLQLQGKYRAGKM